VNGQGHYVKVPHTVKVKVAYHIKRYNMKWMT